MKKFCLWVSILVSLTFSSPAIALAIDPPTHVDDSIRLNTTQVQGGVARGILASTPLNTLLQNAFTIIFTVAALLVLLMLIWGAISWIMSGGEKEAIGKARGRITNALIGLAILALAFFIVRVVGQIVGFNVLSNLQLPQLDNGAPATQTQTLTPAQAQRATQLNCGARGMAFNIATNDCVNP